MRTMAQWGIGEEISGERSFKANKAMELLRRDKGPSLGHMVAYYMVAMKCGVVCWFFLMRSKMVLQRLSLLMA